MELIYFFIAIIISYILFSILFGALNNSILRVFVPLQKLTSRLKRKRTLYVFSYICTVIIVIKASEIYSFNIISFGVALGLVSALNNIVFEKGIINNSKK